LSHIGTFLASVITHGTLSSSIPLPPMMRNAAIHRAPEETSQPRNWMTPGNYLQTLANPMPVTEDSTIFPVNGFSYSGFNQSQMTRNDSRMISPVPEWNSQIPDSQQDPENWRQVDYNVGMPDFPARTQAPSFYWMENSAVNSFSASSGGAVLPGSLTNENLTNLDMQLDQMSSKPISKPQIRPMDAMRDSADGRSAQPRRQRTQSEYVQP
jgi:hypothetical protein